MSEEFIVIRGAHEHNLKHINLSLPRNQLIVVTGLSGSGKSSLAFDTLYAEGQRRYVESLSAYARQFLDRLEKPKVDHIEGLSPAIAIEQRSAGGNPRSTVATQTEIHDYLRVLFARLGVPHCPFSGVPLTRQSSQEIVDQVRKQATGKDVTLFAPIVRGRKGEHNELFTELKRQGFVRVRVEGKLYDLDEPPVLDKNRKHTIDVLVDRLLLDQEEEFLRLAESVETGLNVGKGLLKCLIRELDSKSESGQEVLFSEHYTSPTHDFSLEELSPRMFSFNSPYGACDTCDGLGTRLEIDPDLVVQDPSKTLKEGAIEPWKRGGRHMLMYYNRLLREVCHHYRVPMNEPFKNLTSKQKRAVLYGSNEDAWDGPFEGVIPNLERRFRQTDSDFVKEDIQRFMSVQPCPDCHGDRLKTASLHVLIAGSSIAQISRLSVEAARAWFEKLEWPASQSEIATPLMKEILNRLQFLNDVGLGYLSLNRIASTLSGGEAQRIRLATQVGSGLVGVMYVMDEPSIGLHQRDNERLLNTLLRLRNLGNTLIVVEHDEETMRRADLIVDLGPGAGKHGGEVVAMGTLDEVKKETRSLTGQYLSGARTIVVPEKRRPVKPKHAIVLKGASEHNLKSIDVSIPLGCFVAVTGVSGSGKSTLVDKILWRALSRQLNHSQLKPGKYKSLSGLQKIDKVIEIDQSPIGRTPRSNPATYAGAFGPIRELFSRTSEARLRGFQPGRFSFNVKGGRCEACQGDGVKRIEMHFLSDVYVQCEVCKGTRYNELTLQVKFKGHSIADVLKLTIDEAVDLFSAVPAISNKLRTLRAVGLGYLELGQPATTLSGGEAQRVKLAKELSKRATGNTLYILDEPTTGLHIADIERLLGVLHRLVEQGNTVLVIEHNLDVIKTADHIIDLGPEGGDAGGEILAEGTPEAVAANSRSYTGRWLTPLLKAKRGQLQLAMVE